MTANYHYPTVRESERYSIGPDLPPIRTFHLSLAGVTANVCSLGASLTSLIIPSPVGDHDVVLAYKSPVEMFRSSNPTYLCAIVGRVANRIAQGRLKLTQDGKEFQLATNNYPNHLHGGELGFSRKNWSAEIIRTGKKEQPAVRFSLFSEHDDQGYPGAVTCFATYYLKPSSDDSSKVSLHLEMSAELQGEISTPINLAQHSYFNLSRHDDPNGILDHKLSMPSQFYTPLKESIPTREVKPLTNDIVMDWKNERVLRNALEDFARSRIGLNSDLVQNVVTHRSVALSDFDLEPFGFDHNYVVDQSSPDGSGLYLVATLKHETSKRSMRVRTSSPGVQLYTANYLEASEPSTAQSKAGAMYYRWQGLCLETQHFPDSVFVDESIHPEFARGKCAILSPSNPLYQHTVVYDLDFEAPARKEQEASEVFRGNDSDGNTYDSVELMWQSEGVSENRKTDWYERASQYYEENCPETVDGVLGGFANISLLDLEGSRNFLEELKNMLTPGWTWSSGAAAECGAGIGRVSKGLLLPLNVTRCDLIESSSRLLSAAPDYIGPTSARCRFFCQGLQDWIPAKAFYSIIWVQWVFCYLTDIDAVSFLRRCGQGLVLGGVICLKENTCTDSDFVLDRDDASVTRSVPYLMHLARQAGLKTVSLQYQTNFPAEIFPVPMIALTPET